MAKKKQLSASEQVLVEAMSAHLRHLLQDLRAQYRRLLAEAERVKQTGGAVGDIYKEVRSLEGKEVTDHGQAKKDRRE